MRGGLLAPLHIRVLTCGQLLSSRRPEDRKGSREEKEGTQPGEMLTGLEVPGLPPGPAVSSGASGFSTGRSEAGKAVSQEDAWIQISKNHRNVRKSPRFKANSVF